MNVLTSCAPALCWIDFGDSSSQGVLQRLVAGGAPMALSTSTLLSEPMGMVFDGSDFFVTTAAGGPVSRVPAAGGNPVVLGTTGGGGLAVDDFCVYWSDYQGIHSLLKTATGP